VPDRYARAGQTTQRLFKVPRCGATRQLGRIGNVSARGSNRDHRLRGQRQVTDTVIFLDLPARTCLYGITQRRLRHRGGRHAAIGVYDQINWSFLRYITSFRRSMSPRVLRLCRQHAGHADVVVLRSRRAATSARFRSR